MGLGASGRRVFALAVLVGAAALMPAQTAAEPFPDYPIKIKIRNASQKPGSSTRGSSASARASPSRFQPAFAPPAATR